MKCVLLATLVAVLAIAVGAGGVAVAQSVQKEVTVVARRAVRLGQTAGGASREEITVQRRVSFADLDLTTPVGAQTLERRIHDAAASACTELDVKVAAKGNGLDVCFKEATDEALTQSRKIVGGKYGGAKK